MPAITTVGKLVITNEIPCSVVTTTEEGNGKEVYVNGDLVHTVGLKNTLHLAPVPGGCALHQTSLSSGSSSVFINDKGVARVGDPYLLEYIVQGSEDVFAGG